MAPILISVPIHFPAAPNRPCPLARPWNAWRSRQLLSYADFELSSLLPANGGDGSKGFVVNGIVDRGRLGGPASTTSRRRRQPGRHRRLAPRGARPGSAAAPDHYERCLPHLRPAGRVPRRVGSQTRSTARRATSSTAPCRRPHRLSAAGPATSTTTASRTWSSGRPADHLPATA